jgi:hypothetical protein
MKLKEAIESIKNRQGEARRLEITREQNALADIAPLITLLKETFQQDGLKGWDFPTYCSGVAYSRYWLEGKYGHVYMNVNSQMPEMVSVSVKDNELAVATFPTTEEGLSFMVLAVAERMKLAHASEMITAPKSFLR